MIDWDGVLREVTAKTGGEFTATYLTEGPAGDAVGCRVEARGGYVELRRADETGADVIVLSYAMMSRLARDWLAFGGRFPSLEDE